VAIALLFMHEEDAFWLLVYIVEYLMPPEYYSRDRQLIGAQVDQVRTRSLLPSHDFRRPLTHYTGCLKSPSHICFCNILEVVGSTEQILFQIKRETWDNFFRIVTKIIYLNLF
jgi:hypothetical protein